MPIPRKSAAAPGSADSADLLHVLMLRRLLTRQQAERVRKYARTNGVGIVPTAASPQILDAARPEGMRTLQRAAAEKVQDGATTVSEMLRVTGR